MAFNLVICLLLAMDVVNAHYEKFENLFEHDEHHVDAISVKKTLKRQLYGQYGAEKLFPGGSQTTNRGGRAGAHRWAPTAYTSNYRPARRPKRGYNYYGGQQQAGYGHPPQYAYNDYATPQHSTWYGPKYMTYEDEPTPEPSPAPTPEPTPQCVDPEDSVVTVDWQSANNGAGPANGQFPNSQVSVTLSNLEELSVFISPNSTNFDPFDYPPSTDTIEIVNYAVKSNWVASFGQNISCLVVYLDSWRGGSGSGSDTEYIFNQPFSSVDLSFGDVENNNTLNCPRRDFCRGTIFFEGPLDQLVLMSSSSSDFQQGVTFSHAIN